MHLDAEWTLLAQVVTIGLLDFDVSHVGCSADGAGGDHSL
jgi:hypothetical protein